MILNFLKEIGLSDKEAQVYLAMLEIGSNSVSVIAKKAGLGRTTVYSVLEGLIKKRFVTFFEKNKLKYFAAEDPQQIQFLLEKKSREAIQQKEQFQDLLPAFLKFTNRFQGMPKVRYFEGLEGIKEIYEDTLKVGKDKLAYSSIPDVENIGLQDYIHNYLGRRVKMGMKVKAIFPDTPQGRAFQLQDARLLRESRLVCPNTYKFRSEINIYGNKMAIMSLQSKFLHGVIIESPEIVETERSVFELAWLGAESQQQAN